MLNSLKYYIKHKLLSVQPNGQYNFLTKKVHKKMDVDLAAKVLNTDYFKEVLVPQPIDDKNWQRIIVFAPHQDDEVIGCGALLHSLAKRNCKVDLVFLTDGRPMGANAQSMVKTRFEEARKVADKINANHISIDIDNVSLEISNDHLNRVVAILKDDQYDAVFTPWALDSPPKHRLCNYLLAQAFKQAGLSPDRQIFNYQVHTALIPNVYLEYTDELEKKQELIAIYQSQTQAQNYAHLSKGLDAWNSRFLPWSPKGRYVEVYHQIPLKAFQELISKYDEHPEEAFKRNENCLKAYHRLKPIS